MVSKVIPKQSREIEEKWKIVVSSATWNATYDVCVSTEEKKAPVHIAYKASINQATGKVYFVLSS